MADATAAPWLSLPAPDAAASPQPTDSIYSEHIRTQNPAQQQQRSSSKSRAFELPPGELSHSRQHGVAGPLQRAIPTSSSLSRP